jgi:ribosomal protein L11 methyltransferase
MFYCFKLNSEANLETAWSALEELGIHVLYSSEDAQSGKEIYGNLPDGMPIEAIVSQVCFISMYAQGTLEQTDWEQQWKMHAYRYEGGFAHLSIKDFGFMQTIPSQWETLRLVPGPGFGDLSHPTTKLMLEVMSKAAIEQCVLDMGCGSGILSLAAIAMGVSFVTGVDIDTAALKHAQENATLNEMDSLINFCTPENIVLPQRPVLLLMNMISSEQLTAWNSIKTMHLHIDLIISSGIPKDERLAYLNQTSGWGWSCLEEIEKEEWLAFRFSL